MVNRKKVVEMPECFASKKAPVHTVVLERASKTDFVQESTNTLCINFMSSFAWPLRTVKEQPMVIVVNRVKSLVQSLSFLLEASASQLPGISRK